MRRLSPAAIALIVLAVVVLIGLVYVYATKGSINPDALSDEAVVTAQSPAEVEAQEQCSASSTYDRIKREILRRAAALRSPELEPFEALAGSAVIRFDNPVLESDGAEGGLIRCSASVSVDLPEGVVAAGNRSSLSTSIDYRLRPDGEGLALGGVDSLAAALSQVVRVEIPEELPGMFGNDMMPADPLAPIDGNVPGQAPPQPTARPSFDCDDASSRGELAVCSDQGLAALDRNMAALYRGAIAAANPAQARLLTTTRDRFLAFRDRCQTRGCVADAYAGRMREIRDIMEGRWQPPR